MSCIWGVNWGVGVVLFVFFLFSSLLYLIFFLLLSVSIYWPFNWIYATKATKKPSTTNFNSSSPSKLNKYLNEPSDFLIGQWRLHSHKQYSSNILDEMLIVEKFKAAVAPRQILRAPKTRNSVPFPTKLKQEARKANTFYFEVQSIEVSRISFFFFFFFFSLLN